METQDNLLMTYLLFGLQISVMKLIKACVPVLILLSVLDSFHSVFSSYIALFHVTSHGRKKIHPTGEKKNIISSSFHHANNKIKYKKTLMSNAG